MNDLEMEIKNATRQELEDWLRADEQIIEERDRLLAAIPECPIHGKCVPHAIEWVEDKLR